MKTLLLITLTLGATKAVFVNDTGKGTLVSQSCFKKAKDAAPCRALEQLDTVSLAKLGPLGNNANPGALLCHAGHGTVVIATAPPKRELAICRYKDGSAVGVGSLLYAAERHRLSGTR